MEVVKKNLFSIICGVIALIALIALIWPVSGMYADFGELLKKRAAVNNDITGLMRQPRVEPIIDPQQNSPVPLKLFPNQARIQQGQDLTASVAASATGVQNKAIEINRRGHDLLLPGSLPRPDQSAKYEFRTRYNNAVRSSGAATQPSLTVGSDNIPDGILKAAAPPTEAEILVAMKRKWDEEFAPKVILVGNQPVNLKQIQGDFLEKTKDFAGEFRRKRASTFRTYIEPDALSVALHMEPTATPSAEDMWFAQMTLWIQQDAARVIAEMNKDSSGILTSPVKHVLRLDVPQGPDMYVTATPPGTAGVGPAAAPPPVDSPEAEIRPLYPRSPTGRVCNYLYDVVHFEVDVVIDANAVQRFLQMLEYKRLITVLKVDMQNVDEKLSKDLGYDYGDSPVVRLSVQCEALFLRDWTARKPPGNIPGVPAGLAPPMPPEVMKFLGVAPPTGGQDALPMAAR